MYQYKCEVLKVYDWDTFTGKIQLWFHVTIVEKIRLSRINAPEVRGKERKKGIESRDYLRELILGKEVMIETEKKWKYWRYIAEVFVWDKNVNDLLVKNWHALLADY